MSGPLSGRRLVVTRRREQAGSLIQGLARRGADVIHIPAISIRPLNGDRLADRLDHLDDYDWILFTSGNAVRCFLDLPTAAGQDALKALRTFSGRVAAIGSATARSLLELGVFIDFIPENFTGEELVLGLGDIDRRKMLLPRARIGRPEIVQMLKERGAIVDDIPLYDTITADPPPSEIAALAQEVDAIIFTSPSSARNFVRIIEERAADRLPSLRAARIACIGPSTADAARALGFGDILVPSEFTIPGLIEAVTADLAGDDK